MGSLAFWGEVNVLCLILFFIIFRGLTKPPNPIDPSQVLFSILSLMPYLFFHGHKKKELNKPYFYPYGTLQVLFLF